MSAMRELLPIR